MKRGSFLASLLGLPLIAKGMIQEEKKEVNDGAIKIKLNEVEYSVPIYTDTAGTDFSSFKFGNHISSFPSIKRN